MLSCFAPATVSFVSGKVNSETLARWPSSKQWLNYSFEHTADAKQSARFRQTLERPDAFCTRRTVLPEISQAFLAMGFDGSRTLLLVDELHNIGSHTIQKDATRTSPTDATSLMSLDRLG